MLNLLKDLYDRAEQLKGKKLLYTLLLTFVLFLLLGFTINYGIAKLLKNNEFNNPNNLENIENTDQEVSYFGIIAYTEPRNYPDENISYLLQNTDGSTIILLKAKDKKLEVSEGLFVTVIGAKEKTSDNKYDVLNVSSIKISTKGSN